jgi:tRNA pseudouridine55 synthase
MNGVLNINKASGVTSHDVVQTVRRILGQKRVGHTGTLDPLATGVLVLCIGQATRIARFLEAGEKESDAVMRLGVTTDTLDADGRVLETRAYTPPDRAEVLRVLNGYVGTITQRPPAYSAVKVHGVPSYKLARAGREEPLKPRSVTVYGIDLIAFEDPFISVRVRCSKGVYIRTLCAEIGDKLGSGAHLTGLVRNRSGIFRKEDAVTAEQLAALSPQGVDRVLVSIDRALADMPAITVNPEEACRITNGNKILRRDPDETGREGVLIRTHDQAGRLIALTRNGGGKLAPEIVFCSKS